MLKLLQSPGLSLTSLIDLKVGPAQDWESRSQVCSPPHWRGNHIPRSPCLCTREAPSLVLLFTSTLGTNAPEKALQVQLVQQSREKPTSSSSGPWTGQAGKPLHEWQCSEGPEAVPCSSSCTRTGDRKGLESLGPLRCLLLRSAAT